METLGLDIFNGSPATESRIQVGFYIVIIQANGTAVIHSAMGKSFVKRAQGGSTGSVEMTVAQAFEKATEWSKYKWENNDKDYLVQEYQLTSRYIREFFQYTTPGIDKAA